MSAELHVLNMKDLIPGLEPLVLWMSNSIELLHFIQHEVPLLLTWRQQDRQEQDKGISLPYVLSYIIRNMC